MVIAVNIADYLGRDIHTPFLLQVANSLAASCPEHTIVLVQPDDFVLPTDNTLTTYPIKLPGKRQVFSWTVYQLRLGKALKRAEASILITPFVLGRSYTKAPQVLVDITPSSAILPSGVKTFYRSHTRKFTAEVKSIVYPSGYPVKKTIAEEFPNTPVATLSAVFLADATVVSGALREQVKEQYAGGQEFFLLPYLPPNVEDILPVLKSFSAFKKRQKSGMKLCVTTTYEDRLEKCKDFIRSYKYREDVAVTLVDTQVKMSEVSSAAYAIIHVEQGDVFKGIIAAGFGSGVPVMMPDYENNKGLFGEAAIYYEQDKEGSLGMWMMEVYKNEYLRKQVSQSARELYVSLHEDSILRLSSLIR
jgi:hypothetical protein